MLGTGSYTDVVPARGGADGRGEGRSASAISTTPMRTGRACVTTPPYTAYLKIAEGVRQPAAPSASFPSSGAATAAAPWSALLAEARQLADSGVKELIVIAQDITRYGMDLEEPTSLAGLLKELCKLDFHWIRLHYLYPEVITDELIDTIAREKKIVHYHGHPHPAL
ncbi:MAG: hypothetical protein ACLT3D_09795 [Lawsonibacter sp.]